MAELSRREGIHPTVYYTWPNDESLTLRIIEVS